MSDDQDFAIETEDRETVAEPTPAPPPLVVIEYRNRGLPSVFVPPALILMAALAILSYQRLTPVRRPGPAPPSDDPAPPRRGRTILVESSSTGVVVGPLVVRAESSPPAATSPPALDAAASQAPPVDDDLSPFDLNATAGLRPVEPSSPTLDAANKPPLAPPAPAAPEAIAAPAPKPRERDPIDAASTASDPEPKRIEHPAIGFKLPQPESNRSSPPSPIRPRHSPK